MLIMIQYNILISTRISLDTNYLWHNFLCDVIDVLLTDLRREGYPETFNPIFQLLQIFRLIASP